MNGPMLLHWRRVNEAGENLKEFTAQVAALPEGQLWRHNQAGDLPGDGKVVDNSALSKIVKANKGKRGFTYTHYDPAVGRNAKAIASSNRRGFTINLSADNLAEADKLCDMGIAPVVTILPTAQITNTETPDGRKVVVCPATTHEDITCADCKLCAWPEREVIIGFPAHGARKKTAESVYTLAA